MQRSGALALGDGLARAIQKIKHAAAIASDQKMTKRIDGRGSQRVGQRPFPAGCQVRSEPVQLPAPADGHRTGPVVSQRTLGNSSGKADLSLDLASLVEQIDPL